MRPHGADISPRAARRARQRATGGKPRNGHRSRARNSARDFFFAVAVGAGRLAPSGRRGVGWVWAQGAATPRAARVARWVGGAMGADNNDTAADAVAAEAAAAALSAALVADPTLAPFLQPGYDAAAYASGVLRSGSAASCTLQLNTGLGALDAELRAEVVAQYDQLLEAVASLRDTERALGDIKLGAGALRASAARVGAELAEPHRQLVERTRQLRNLSAVVDLLRRSVRALKLAAKLRDHVDDEGDGGTATKAAVRPDAAKAAQLLAEIGVLLVDTDVARVEAVAAQRPFIDRAAIKVRAQAEASLRSGMETLSQAEVGQALQIFFNSGELAGVVQELTRRYTVQVSQTAANALDATSIASGTKGGGAGRGKAPSTSQWREEVWQRLTASMDDMYAAVVAMWHLQRVAAKKRDPISHACFLDVIVEEGQSTLTERFWKAFTDVIAQHMANAFRTSGFIKDALVEGYPRLATLFDGLIDRLERDTEVRGVAPAVPVNGRAMLFHALAPFRDAFAQASAERYESAVGSLFARGAVPTRGAALKLCAALRTEVARANSKAGVGAVSAAASTYASSTDADMAVLVASPLSQALYQLAERVEYHITTGPETKQVTAAPSSTQQRNFNLCGLLADVHKDVAMHVLTQLPAEAVAVLSPALQNMFAAGTDNLNPIFRAMAQRLEETLLTMHDPGVYVDDGAQVGAVTEPSTYMRNLRRQLQAFSTDFVSKMLSAGPVGSVARTLSPPQKHPMVGKLVLKMARRLCAFFVRHAALVRPLGDAGRLRMARDIAELEAAIGEALVPAEAIGAPYRALRAFKPLLFLETTKVPGSLLLHDLPTSAVLHHLLGRAPAALQSPHAQSGITVSQYSVWMDRHADADAVSRVQQCTDAFARSPDGASAGEGVLEAISAVSDGSAA